MRRILLPLGVGLVTVACSREPELPSAGSGGGGFGGVPPVGEMGGVTDMGSAKASGGSPGGVGGGSGVASTGMAGEAGAGGAAGGGDGAKGGAGSRSIPVLVAQGHVGRTVVSCDGGRTWVAERSTISEFRHVAEQDLRCWSDNLDPDSDPTQEGEPAAVFELDCDHQAEPGRGIAFGGGQFLATFGWGEPGRIVMSPDGASWTVPLEGTTFGGVAYVQDVWLLGGRSARRSTDGGKTFGPEQDSGLDGWNVRRVGMTPSWGSRAILVGEAGDAVVTSDAGVTWWKPRLFPGACGAAIQTEGGIVSSAAVWLVIGGDGSVCRSTDGGETWEANSLGKGLSSHAVWTGEQFMVWARGTLFSSKDGAQWQETPTSPPDIEVGPVAADSQGRLAAVRGGWDVWYQDQRFYFSTDGVLWTESESYLGGHPIRAMTSGDIPRPAVCDEGP